MRGEDIIIKRSEKGIVIDIHMGLEFPEEAGDVVAKLVHCLSQGVARALPGITTERAAHDILLAMADKIVSGIQYEIIPGRTN
jgi:hypothetical protein